MPLHNWFNEHPKIAGLLLAVLFLGAAAAVWNTTRPRRVVAAKVWFYDLSNHQLFADDADKVPPIDGPGGPRSGVRAAVFACGDCANAALRQVGVLTSHTSAVQELLRSANEETRREQQAAIEAGTLIASPPAGGGQALWHPLNTPEGIAIAQSRITCPTGDAKPCAAPR